MNRDYVDSSHLDLLHARSGKFVDVITIVITAKLSAYFEVISLLLYRVHHGADKARFGTYNLIGTHVEATP